ncbi:hypothetical protein NOCA2220160 [metagenome]|uniref:RNA polymerase sigma-70 region 2 domain-containing protein n=1 Tax=metagenome TaxID=256318 RepID=A0A2P2BYY8_9ZZZZ
MDKDTEAVAELYAAVCPGLIGYLTVLGGNRADAEEVAHEAFVRLLERWSTVAEYDDPRAWLRQVATRMLISRARRRTVARLALPRLRGASTTEPPTGDRLDRRRGTGSTSPPRWRPCPSARAPSSSCTTCTTCPSTRSPTSCGSRSAR